MIRVALVAHALLVVLQAVAFSADEYEQPPIEYSASKPNNSVSQLQGMMDRNEVSLKRDAKQGYLRDLLAKLKINPESQILVYSKTSLQRDTIAPRTPRAIYFNDDVYVGYCHNGVEIETSIADPHLGAVFYTLDQNGHKKPALVRETQRCLQCHGTAATDNIPGFLMRSLYVSANGLPILSEGSHYVDDTTPLEDRWGGWYVTGSLGGQRHLGNLIISDPDMPKPWKRETPRDIVSLTNEIPVDNYLTPYSDTVALMVFAHQTYVHNLITKANFTARQALSYQAMFNRTLGKPADDPLESTTRRIESAGEALVRALLFANEAPIKEPVSGGSGFAESFSRIGPRDQQGRSLRDFDLKTRLFKYPCSYLIYSGSFDKLPLVMKRFVAKRLHEILGGSGDEAYSHLSADDRQAILEIIQGTKPDLWEIVDTAPSGSATQ